MKACFGGNLVVKMCNTCKRAESLPTNEALALVAKAMAKKHRQCLDDLIGRLIDCEEAPRNLDVEESWERWRQKPV
jgi:hypothetical protein